MCYIIQDLILILSNSRKFNLSGDTMFRFFENFSIVVSRILKNVNAVTGALLLVSCFFLPLHAGRVFTDQATGKTVIELTVDGLPNSTSTDVYRFVFGLLRR